MRVPLTYPRLTVPLLAIALYVLKTFSFSLPLFASISPKELLLFNVMFLAPVRFLRNTAASVLLFLPTMSLIRGVRAVMIPGADLITAGATLVITVFMISGRPSSSSFLK